MRLTAVVDDFQVHPRGGFARVAEGRRVRRQSAVSFAVTHGHYGLRRVAHQARWKKTSGRVKNNNYYYDLIFTRKKNNTHTHTHASRSAETENPV